jgi:hypothetical protein
MHVAGKAQLVLIITDQAWRKDIIGLSLIG